MSQPSSALGMAARSIGAENALIGRLSDSYPDRWPAPGSSAWVRVSPPYHPGRAPDDARGSPVAVKAHVPSDSTRL